MDHWSHLQPGSAQKRRLACFFLGTCQDLSHSKVNTQHLFLCRPLIKDQMFTAHHSFSGNTWKVMSNISQMRWGTHVCRRSNLRKQPELKIIKVTAHLPITSDSGVASATENLEVSLNPEDLKYLKRDLQRKQMILYTVHLYHPISKPLKQLHNLLLKRQRCLKRENIDATAKSGREMDRVDCRKRWLKSNWFLINCFFGLLTIWIRMSFSERSSRLKTSQTSCLLRPKTCHRLPLSILCFQHVGSTQFSAKCEMNSASNHQEFGKIPLDVSSQP